MNSENEMNEIEEGLKNAFAGFVEARKKGDAEAEEKAFAEWSRLRAVMYDQMDAAEIEKEDGIYGLPESRCGCGSALRLHIHTFSNGGDPVRKFYVDCSGCRRTSVWAKTREEAIKAFVDGIEPDLPKGFRMSEIPDEEPSGEIPEEQAV